MKAQNNNNEKTILSWTIAATGIAYNEQKN